MVVAGGGPPDSEEHLPQGIGQCVEGMRPGRLQLLASPNYCTEGNGCRCGADGGYRGRRPATAVSPGTRGVHDHFHGRCPPAEWRRRTRSGTCWPPPRWWTGNNDLLWEPA
ncbi:MAG: hypothetical protein MZU95_09320 [Desulfomicrobium escambiense]|nr:hypothetical protein [Desulfomicrobium escambiense]